MSKHILNVQGLRTHFRTVEGIAKAVDDVSFHASAGETLGIVGESGSGKSVSALSIMRLIKNPPGKIVEGRIEFDGTNLLDLSENEMRKVRGNRISMIFQEPMTALNPVHTVGRQITEVYSLHFPLMTSAQKTAAAVGMLEKVGIPDPEKVTGKYPHQLSGGMRQRVVIAMALACEPDILIADEPTTALDVTVQAQIMNLVLELKDRIDMSVILITHDLGIIAENCDEVVIMYAGRIVEQADVHALYKNPCHPYTKGLLESIPSRAQTAKTRLPTIRGTVPSLSQMSEGCRFADRCPLVEDRCRIKAPELRSIAENRSVACYLK